MKIANIGKENFHIFQTTCGISTKSSEKNVSYDNIKNHKISRFYLLSRKYSFGSLKVLLNSFKVVQLTMSGSVNRIDKHLR